MKNKALEETCKKKFEKKMNWQLVNLPKIQDNRGNLTFIEGQNHVPFDIARIFYLYDVPGGGSRAGHAHKNLQQFLISVSGSFDIHLDDGKNNKETITLNRSYYGLLINPMVWSEINNFSSGAVCLVLASNVFDESDYYREYNKFLEGIKNESSFS